MQRQNISSGTSYEEEIGYSRAVRVGPHVHVSGTTGLDENGELVDPSDPYAQAVQTFENIEWALEEAGGAMDDVVRTRIYVADIDDWRAVNRAFTEFLGDVGPASTLVESALADPDMLVEVDADAYLLDDDE